ncbi:hypothetical protein FR210_16835 [Listeria monocytogenes]|nr:hypothetical protein [Listeria monocytogenes]EAE4662746.1 hypothetical protein [Listeria monocytogenes]EAE4671732.1 hypothetical protein [Listeria monocytogenes]EAG7216067.1 hypothetical protein [Listeria monocytogenes]EAG7849913.1 hypothetical protein [Listeria monocytogenes]
MYKITGEIKGNLLIDTNSPLALGTPIGCSSNLENCDFCISKVICKKKLSNKNLSDLLKTGRTEFLKGWVGKSGKKFNAALSLKNGDLNFVFSPPISREKA